MIKIKYNKAYYKGLSKPVECVTWYEAIEFCNRWSLLEGRTPCYSLNGSVNPDDWGKPELNVPGRQNSWNRTHKVAAKKPNALGIYDMTGNVSEWCWDWDYYKNPYPETPQTNPTGPESGMYRIRRGGDYGDYFLCKVSARDCSLPVNSFNGLGIRVVYSAR